MNFQIHRIIDQGFVPDPSGDSTYTVEQLLLVSPGDEWGEAETATEAMSAWAAALGSGLAELYRELEARYRLGETSEASFLEDFPEHAADVERLKKEHKAILRSVRDLLDQLWWSDWPSAGPDVELRVRDTLTRISRHDRAENDLLQRAYTLDLGVAG